MSTLRTNQAPTILFGAFDRHNFGDLIFPHIAAALLGDDNLFFAGLVARDMSSVGGFGTRPIAQLAKELGDRPLNIMHAGGELLTCDAWQAAVMVQAPEQVQLLIQRLERHSEERAKWVRDLLGFDALAPYVLERALFPGAVNLLYTAVGGVELDARDGPFRAEVLAKLKSADYISVRDLRTQSHLRQFGIHSRLVPDPAVLVAELFGERIEHAAQKGEVAAIRAAFPHGYIAFQFSADFSDDETLRRLAVQLDALVKVSGYGVVLFRAGAAPWHDELECYRRLAGFTQAAQVRLFSSLNIWEICALLAQCSAYCGSSLHGRIVAMAFGLPRINLNPPNAESRSGKQMAYAATWELPGYPATVDVEGVAEGIEKAMAYDGEQLRVHALTLTARYLEEFATVRSLLASR